MTNNARESNPQIILSGAKILQSEEHASLYQTVRQGISCSDKWYPVFYQPLFENVALLYQSIEHPDFEKSEGEPITFLEVALIRAQYALRLLAQHPLPKKSEPEKAFWEKDAWVFGLVSLALLQDISAFFSSYGFLVGEKGRDLRDWKLGIDMLWRRGQSMVLERRLTKCLVEPASCLPLAWSCIPYEAQQWMRGLSNLMDDWYAGLIQGTTPSDIGSLLSQVNKSLPIKNANKIIKSQSHNEVRADNESLNFASILGGNHHG